MKNWLQALAALTILFCFNASNLRAQANAGVLRGTVTDPSGAAIPNASVIATGAQGAVKVANTSASGEYVISGLAPDTYTIRGSAKGFTLFEKTGFAVQTGRPASLDIRMQVASDRQEVTVTEVARVNTDPSNNAGALVLRREEIDMLSDNPDDLAADLQALAGPSAGPNGGQIFIDGFTGGQLPPKESIREIRINSNPFSSEYDKLGFGRIEIFTRPGTDRYRGQAFFNYGDSIFNSRNPFGGSVKPPYNQKEFGGNFSGPLNKKSSFFLDFDRRDVAEVAVINAITLDDAFNPANFVTSIVKPTVRTSLNPRFDYALNKDNTVVVRYAWAQNSRQDQGLSTFTLPTRGYNTDSTVNTLQVTETSILNTRMIDETRFQFMRTYGNQNALSLDPTVQVLDSFSSGGANIGNSYTHEKRWELYNGMSITHGRHFVKFGGRVRGVNQENMTQSGYNGTYTFTSLAAYRATILGNNAGLTPAQIRANGGGSSQFSITGGNPLGNVTQTDAGLFIQDDWKVSPLFTLSLGLRWESQGNIHDKSDWAPRVGFAWAVDGSKTRQAKTVIRGGFGVFYDRFTEDTVLSARMLDGTHQQQFLIQNPGFFPVIPSLATLASSLQPQAIRQLDPNLHAPMMAQMAIGVERQLPKNITVSVNYTRTHGAHVLRSRNINAPMPGTGIRPFGGTNNLFSYESSGIFNQQQLMSNVNARVNSKFSLFGFYVYGNAKSNADGLGSFPMNQYDTSLDYSRASFDVHHRSFIGGSITAPFNLRFSPMISMATGNPYNVIVGKDLNGDSQFNDRPAFATDLTRPSVFKTAIGNFDTLPIAGQTIIPRNYGNGPGNFTVNMRVSRTFGFGERNTASADPNAAGGDSERRGRMMSGGGGSRGGGGSHGGGGGSHGGGPFGGEASGKKYTLTFSASARNLFNHVNLAAPTGNLSSTLFGVSNALGGGFFTTSSANRRLELQMRFAF
jgi:uncharacterized membrane protein YgcG